MKPLTILLLMLTVQFAILADDYGYPIKNPLFSTIIGTPPALSYKVEQAPVDMHSIESISKIELPEIMWDIDEVKFSSSVQDTKAPLIFIIAGTGASYNSETMQFLQNAFYGAGFHTICLSSPISRDFIATCSTSATPGITDEDSKDIYRLMQRAYSEIKDDIEVTNFNLTGYSLGALESAFISKLDEEERVFDFKKVLLINPPVDVYASVTKLDNFLPGLEKNKKDILTIVMDKMTIYFAKRGEVGFGPNFLLEINKLSPLTDDEAKRIIGVTFRMFLAETVFISDIINNKKLIVKKPLTISDPLLPYFKESLLWDFEHYVDYFVLPHWKLSNPGKTKEDMIETTSMRSISDYLAKSKKISVVHNIDDIIVTDEDLKYLSQIFKERLKLYPRGGHCGNIPYVDNAKYMLNYFK